MWPFTAWNARRSIDEAIARKRNERAAAIQEGLDRAGLPAAHNGGSSNDVDYISADVETISSNIRQRRWKAADVMRAFVRQAAQAHTRTNCLTEILFVQAIQEAEALDEWIITASDQQLNEKSLLGVPVSLKDQIDVTGFPSSMGFVRCGLATIVAREGKGATGFHRSPQSRRMGKAAHCRHRLTTCTLRLRCSHRIQILGRFRHRGCRDS